MLLLVGVPEEQVGGATSTIQAYYPAAQVEAARAHPIESLLQRLEA